MTTSRLMSKLVPLKSEAVNSINLANIVIRYFSILVTTMFLPQTPRITDNSFTNGAGVQGKFVWSRRHYWSSIALTSYHMTHRHWACQVPRIGQPCLSCPFVSISAPIGEITSQLFTRPWFSLRPFRYWRVRSSRLLYGFSSIYSTYESWYSVV